MCKLFLFCRKNDRVSTLSNEENGPEITSIFRQFEVKSQSDSSAPTLHRGVSCHECVKSGKTIAEILKKIPSKPLCARNCTRSRGTIFPQHFL